MTSEYPLKDAAPPPGAPRLVGIVNVTPDSFSDGGRFYDADAAVAHALRLVAEGADGLDIGGESTRPGARELPLADELGRVVPVISALRSRLGIPISIDTRKPEVAQAALAAGATVWNDVSALTFSQKSVSMAATLNVPIILMHAQGLPETMQDAPIYEDVVDEVCQYLAQRIAALRAAGYHRPDSDIILDPGIGFGKTLAHNVALLRNLDRLTALGHPVLLGASRKRFIAALDEARHPAQSDLKRKEAQEAQGAINRLGGSLAAAVCGYRAGVAYLRVHDVAQTRQCLAVSGAIMP